MKARRNRCSLCKAGDHTYRQCPRRPDRLIHLPVPEEHAETILGERLSYIVQACSYDEPNFLRTLMLSCYLQGALDGQRPEVGEAMRALGGAG